MIATSTSSLLIAIAFFALGFMAGRRSKGVLQKLKFWEKVDER